MRDHLSRGNDLIRTVCPGGSIDWGPIVGDQLSRDQICHSPNVLVPQNPVDMHCMKNNVSSEIIQRLYQRYTYRVLQAIQMKLVLLCVRAERAVLGIDKTALKFKHEIWIG